MPVYQQMTLSPKLGVVEISTLWHFRLPLLIQMFIKVASSPILSGIGMPSQILWSHLLKMQRILLLSSLLWWELGTNSLITGPGEWLSLRRFTSKLSWSWSWSCQGSVIIYKLGGGAGQFFGKSVISRRPPPPPNFYFEVDPPPPNNRRFVMLTPSPPQWPLPIAQPANHNTRISKWLSKCY